MKYKAQFNVHAAITADSWEDAHWQANELKKPLSKAIADAGLTQTLFWVGLDMVVQVDQKQPTIHQLEHPECPE